MNSAYTTGGLHWTQPQSTSGTASPFTSAPTALHSSPNQLVPVKGGKDGTVAESTRKWPVASP